MFLTNIIIVFQDDQVTDAKGLPFAGPQSFDELESEDLYTKYKVTFHFNTIINNNQLCHGLGLDSK